MNTRAYPVNPPKVVAVATDAYLTQTHPFADPDLPAGYVPRYGQDITFATGRQPSGGHNVGSTVADLQPRMERLLSSFASGDRSGMARRLFDEFLAKQTSVKYFNDSSLSQAAAGHANIRHFCNAALSAPGTATANPSRPRIHQALRAANWNLYQIRVPTDLGVPAFNQGSKWRRTEDFNNGLGLMINGVQHVFVVATHYHYDSAARRYGIVLRYYFYDVFGLDDDDLREYGATSTWFNTDEAIGITAWWQFQHQHNYAPLVTRFVLEVATEVPAV